VVKKLIWSEAAWFDLEAATEYIAQDSPIYAKTFVEEIRQAARSLKRFSERGRIVPEVSNNNIREIFPVGYRLVYRVSEDTVTIMALIHHARSWGNVSRDF
jgi:plasmid stabilization system protein ParE